MRKRIELWFNRLSIAVLAIAMAVSFSVFFGTETLASWNSTAATAFASGSGTESNPYVIKTASQMGYFVNQMDQGVTYDGLYIKIGANLNLTNYSWTYDSSTATFNGTLDGQCYTITTNCPLLPNIGANGVVQKLNVVANTLSGKSILCCRNDGLIQLCTTRGDVPAEGSASCIAGLICEDNFGTVRWCGAVGKASAVGDDSDAYAGMVAWNEGTVDSCFAAVSVSASAPGKYNDPYRHPLSNGKWGGSQTVTNSYYDKSLYTLATSYGTGLTTAVMQSEEFLTMIAGNTLPGTQWVTGSDGYPTLQSCGTGTVTFQGWEGVSKATYHSASTSVTLKPSTSGTLYYTTDGSDPRTSSTRRSTTSSSVSVRLSRDMTLSAVLYSGGKYGAVNRTEFVYLPGSGTESSPYQILTKKGLDAVRMDPAACYQLTVDLTYTADDYTFGGVAAGGWVPVEEFSGSFDGAGHSITGLHGNNGGLVDYNSGTITSLRMVDHRLFCGSSTGPIANTNAGTITRCYARSAFSVSDLPSASYFTYNSYSGGIAGYNNGTVSYCTVDGVVPGREVTDDGVHYLGGIVGIYGDVQNCISNALIVSQGAENYIHAGGIAGALTDVENSLSTATFYIDSRINYSAFISGIVGGHFSNGYARYCVANSPSVTQSADAYIRLEKYTWAPSPYNCSYLYSESHQDNYPDLDFDSGWMIWDSSILPQGVMDEDGHCYSVSSYTPETCTADGRITVTCDLCFTSKTETLSALGHREVTDKAVEATCNTLGKTEGKHCSRCNIVITAQKDVAMIPHDYVRGTCAVCKGECPEEDTGTYSNLTWTFRKSTSTLTITGSGALADSEASVPWVAYRNSISALELPKGLTRIGKNVFEGHSLLTDITIPGNVTAIAEGAFADCAALKNVHFAGAAPQTLGDKGSETAGFGDVTFYYDCNRSGWLTGSRYDADAKTWAGYPLVSEKHAEVTDPAAAATCTETGLTEGMHCSVCKEVLIAQEVVPALGHSFSGDTCTRCELAGGSCGNNVSWVLSADGVLTISGKGAMKSYVSTSYIPWSYYANDIQRVIVKQGVTTIGSRAFNNCTSLTSVTLPDGITSIGSSAFENCSSLSSISLPEGITSIGQAAFKNCSSLSSISLPEGITSIGQAAFFSCSSLSSISLPEGITSIGSYAFSSCSSLSSISLPEGITSIGEYTFSSCSSLSSISLPEGITSIGSYAFEFCSSLSSISLPEGITSIGQSAFSSCSSLLYIELPATLEQIGYQAFILDSKLDHVFYRGASKSDITIEKSNDPLVNATWHCNVKDGDLRYVKNCENRGMFCAICNDFITREKAESGEHTFDDITDITCDDCGFTQKVSGIAALSFPEKTEYAVFTEELDASGGVLDVSYDRGAQVTMDMTEDMISGFDNTRLGYQSLTVSYGGFNQYYGVTVVPGTPDAIEISSLPNKQEYLLNEEFDLMGLSLRAVYNERGSVSLPLSLAHISEVDMSTPGTKTVTVSVGGTSAAFEIQVYSMCDVIWDASDYPESLHNYKANTNETQVFTADGAMQLVLQFSDKTYTEADTDYIYVYDGQDNQLAVYSGSEAAGQTLTVPGDTVKVRLVSDDSVNKYGYSFDSITATMPEHTFGDWYVITEPGCEEDGIQERACQGLTCGWTETQSIPAKGHTEAIEPGKPATCTEPGITDGKHCSECGAILAVPAEIPALGHSFTDNVCTNCGLISGTCGENLTWVLEDDTLTISGTGDMTDYSNSDRAPWFEHRESINSVVLDSRITSIGSWAFCLCTKMSEIELPTDLTEIGQYAFAACHGLTSMEFPEYLARIDMGAFDECPNLAEITFCGDAPAAQSKIFDDYFRATAYYPYGPTWTEEVMQSYGGHLTWVCYCLNAHAEVIDQGKDATCTESGLTEGKHCDLCGEILVAQEIIPAKGHTEVIDEAVDATCTETGLTEGKHCSVCDEVLVEQEIIPAKGHTEVIDKAVEATCTETGLTEGKHCSICDEVLTEQETIPAKGHSVVIDKAVDATCTETGLTEGLHCADCDTVLVEQEIIPAIGHSYELPVFEWDEDYCCTAVFTCENCGEIQNIDCDVTAEILPEDESIVYTAEAVLDGILYTDSQTVAFPESDHTHTTDDQWYTDWDSHWMQCSECGEILDQETHTPDADQICTVCGMELSTPPELNWFLDRSGDSDSYLWATGRYVWIAGTYGNAP